MDSISSRPDPDEKQVKTLFSIITAIHVVGSVIGGALLGGIVYVAVHFLAKVW